MAGLTRIAVLRAYPTRRRRRISSSLLPLNIGPQISSSWPCGLAAEASRWGRALIGNAILAARSDGVPVRVARRDGVAPTGRGRAAPRRASGRRRAGLRRARGQVRAFPPPPRPALRVVEGRRGGGRSGDVARGADRHRAVRGPLVLEDVAVPDPDQQGEDARTAGGADP